LKSKLLLIVILLLLLIARVIIIFFQQFNLIAIKNKGVRSGLATSAAMYGMTEIAIMKQTGHHTRGMVDRYVQAGLRYKNNVSSILKNL
jgi:flagellar basal body-associated protein FliL